MAFLAAHFCGCGFGLPLPIDFFACSQLATADAARRWLQELQRNPHQTKPNERSNHSTKIRTTTTRKTTLNGCAIGT